jgi:hypothetical protein
VYGGKFDHSQFSWHAERIRSSEDVWIETSKLLDAIRKNSSAPVPDEVLEYLRRRLDGEVPKPRGRRPGGTLSYLRNQLISIHYRRYFDWLEKREKTLGLDGWSLIRNVDWWEGPPSERAARMTQKRYGRYITWQSVRQIALGPSGS